MKDTITTRLQKRDHEYLKKITEKKGFRGIGVTISKIIDMIKKLKLEEEF